MPLSSGSDNQKVLSYLKKVAPYSVIEAGNQLASSDSILECARSADCIHGLVRDQEATEYTLSLRVLSTQEIEAHCSCSTDDQMSEQWCPHAAALLLRAADLNFFDTDFGFSSKEALYRPPAATADQIAKTLRELSLLKVINKEQPKSPPQVKVCLDFSSDRMGVRVYFDGIQCQPGLFGESDVVSPRALDNVLLQVLEEHGSWDEEKKLWYVNASNHIELVLGLLGEYPEVLALKREKPLKFSREPLEAKIIIEWLKGGAELSLHWVFSPTKECPKNSETVGTGPHWTCINNTIYRLSPAASRLSSLFVMAPTLRLSRSQLPPVLEVLAETQQSDVLQIRNIDDQPETVVKAPKPILKLERAHHFNEHFWSQDIMRLKGLFEFEYPEPPGNQNVVYLPDRAKEQESLDKLRELGFVYDSSARAYQLSGDSALQLLKDGKRTFPRDWDVSGLDDLRKSVKFADLLLNISISGAGNAGSEYECHISLSQNNANIPLSMIFKNAKLDSERWIRLDSGAYAKIPGGDLRQLKTALGIIDANFRLSNTIRSKISTAQAISLARSDDSQVRVNLDQGLKVLSEKVNDFTSIQKVKISSHFSGKLRHYQEDGLNWLAFLHDFGLCGILADEMGLGKTVQALALLQSLQERKTKSGKNSKPSLVVAPTSVITNWLYETRRFTPNLKVLLLHGPDRKKHFSSFKDYDIIITSYALLRIDKLELEKHRFRYVILDEAQNIKNPHAAVTKSAKCIRAESRLALSGTPTENRPLELWSIMDFLMPGYLGSLEFFRNFVEKPIIESGTGVHVAKFLNSKTRPFILRRTKAEVEKDLPPKIESELHVEMTDSQRSLYEQVLAEVRPKVFDAVNKKGIRGASVSILAALLRLRQICNHPNSIDALKAVPDFDSGKFALLKDLTTEALENGRKILLFSQFREMLAIIRRWLEEQSVNYLYLDGTTTKRQDLVDRFNYDDKVRLFLISLKAGGLGLNLTAADTVIIYDPWWNPAVEHQAVDRAHRIGQTKTVSVYRLVTENSIEQKIMELKKKKAKLVEALINENGLSTLSLSRSDLEILFSSFGE